MIFGVLVIATIAAFWVAQRLKHGPSIVQQLSFTPLLSPNGDGRHDAAAIGFLLARRERLTVQVIGPAPGVGVVATLVDRRSTRAYRRVNLRWDGTSRIGARVPDGRYKFVIRAGPKVIVVPRSVVVDTQPPAVRLTATARSADRAEFRLVTPGRRRQLIIYRRKHGSWTAFRRADRLAFGQTRIAVRPVGWPPGRYLLVANARDVAGNVGYSTPVDEKRVPTTVAANLRTN